MCVALQAHRSVILIGVRMGAIIRGGLSAATLTALTAAAAGCAGPVAVPVPQPAPAESTHRLCAALQDELPSSVLDQVRRPTEPESALTAAWGNPPITLRCGVATPPALTPTSLLATINDIDWLPEQRSAGYVFTTVHREVNVEVAVPDAFAPETDVLVDLQPAIDATIPLTATE